MLLCVVVFQLYKCYLKIYYIAIVNLLLSRSDTAKITVKNFIDYLESIRNMIDRFFDFSPLFLSKYSLIKKN